MYSLDVGCYWNAAALLTPLESVGASFYCVTCMDEYSAFVVTAAIKRLLVVTDLVVEHVHMDLELVEKQVGRFVVLKVEVGSQLSIFGANQILHQR